MAAFITITCDHGDLHSTCAVRYTCDTLDVAEAHRRARRSGWTTQAGQDRCPAHSPRRDTNRGR